MVSLFQLACIRRMLFSDIRDHVWEVSANQPSSCLHFSFSLPFCNAAFIKVLRQLILHCAVASLYTQKCSKCVWLDKRNRLLWKCDRATNYMAFRLTAHSLIPRAMQCHHHTTSCLLSWFWIYQWFIQGLQAGGGRKTFQKFRRIWFYPSH